MVGRRDTDALAGGVKKASAMALHPCAIFSKTHAWVQRQPRVQPQSLSERTPCNDDAPRTRTLSARLAISVVAMTFDASIATLTIVAEGIGLRCS